MQSTIFIVVVIAISLLISFLARGYFSGVAGLVAADETAHFSSDFFAENDRGSLLGHLNPEYNPAFEPSARRVIHYFWMLDIESEDIRAEKLGEFRNKRISVVTLKELEQQIQDCRRVTDDIYNYCGTFKKAHPRDVGTLGNYWAPKAKSKPKKSRLSRTRKS
jgi:hypothetical protein